MGRNRLSGREFGVLMREYIDRRGARLLDEDRHWRDMVPDHTERAAESTFRTLRTCAASGVPFPTGIIGGKAAAGGVKALAIALAAAAAIGAGAYAAAPAVCGLAERAIPAAESVRHMAPADYIIPDPGGALTLTDEGFSKKMAYRWFGSPDQELLVEIACSLPEEAEQEGDVDAVDVGGLWGTVCETEHTQLLILHDGDVFILIEYFNAGRDELLDYAEAFVRANE